MLLIYVNPTQSNTTGRRKQLQKIYIDLGNNKLPSDFFRDLLFVCPGVIIQCIRNDLSIVY
jgi:hypothetical protein